MTWGGWEEGVGWVGGTGKSFGDGREELEVGAMKLLLVLSNAIGTQTSKMAAPQQQIRLCQRRL